MPGKALFFLEEAEHPISVVLRPAVVREKRQLKMRMDIDKTRHNDRMFQTDNAMAWISPHHCGGLANGMDPSLFYDDGAGNKGNTVKPCNDPVCMNEHMPHTVP